MTQEGVTYKLRCGKCPPCKNNRVSSWVFRLLQEEKNSEAALFVTLTYDTEHVPITPKGYMTLSLSDVQKFFKRLRKKTNMGKVTYYLAGEYGSIRMRPHYHIILFNASESAVQEAWQLGNVYFGNVKNDSVAYTLKYICKKPLVPAHKNDDRKKEFSVMSKGIGKAYIDDSRMVKWHNDDPINRQYCPLQDGGRAAMSRYYKERIFSDVTRAQVSTHFKNQAAAKPELTEVERWEKLQSDHYQFEKMYRNNNNRSTD